MVNLLGMDEIAERLEHAVLIAKEAGDLTLKYFLNNDLSVDRKGDGSPVTVADRGAEELLRKRISARFADDAILGEEFPEQPGTSGFRWVLDPIDGTKSFIHGVPLYTTLIAVLDERQTSPGEPVLGVIRAPATGEVVFARSGGGCWRAQGESEPEKTHVTTQKRFAEGLLLTTDVSDFAEDRPTDESRVYQELQNRARLTRTWGDAYGYLMVASGRAEVMIDPWMSLWDAAALMPVIQEAGGTFTDWQGKPTVHTGDAIATNGLLHDEVLAVIQG